MSTPADPAAAVLTPRAGEDVLALPEAAAEAPLDFDGFVVATSPRLLSVAMLLCGDRGRAEDLLQDAYAKTYLHWTRVSDTDPLAYVRRVLLNTYIDWWRRKPWREVPDDGVELIDKGRPDPAVEIRLTVARALQTLSRKERAVIVLRYFDGLTVAEVAQQLRVAEGTVKSTTARALARLRRNSDVLSLTADPRDRSGGIDHG